MCGGVGESITQLLENGWLLVAAMGGIGKRGDREVT